MELQSDKLVLGQNSNSTHSNSGQILYVTVICLTMKDYRFPNWCSSNSNNGKNGQPYP